MILKKMGVFMITTDFEVLRRISDPTSYKECQERAVFEKMQESLTASKRDGWGLSAIQVGLPVRACIVRYEKLSLNMINPRIEKSEDPIIFPGEACLSVPNMQVNTRRHNKIVACWYDYDTQKDARAVFIGTEAVIIQHEIDHMNGIIITDKETL